MPFSKWNYCKSNSKSAPVERPESKRDNSSIVPHFSPFGWTLKNVGIHNRWRIVAAIQAMHRGKPVKNACGGPAGVAIVDRPSYFDGASIYHPRALSA